MPTRSQGARTDQSMEEYLAEVGAKIDDLIDKATEARESVEDKLTQLRIQGATTRKRSEEALDELKLALDSAWDELNRAWSDIKQGTERAAKKLRSD